ncbi:type III PLP-dependent enzyme [Roseicella frigidaeris]|uniref:ornithine decarboxylase n=1 Tax=Roseicella frigidaeris TaxID=2230885 RepID=A0A327M9L2_9PROT|nr:type III PLP-dependent enzyme [Roseicella frigidaeris]RAI59095.1 type III PLP-dependent enzyme [Roseicella frigidaeris]
MDLLRARAAGAPPSLPAVDALVAVARPEEPMHCLRPAAITEAAAGFVAGFPGETLYAVKCNPEPAVLRAVWAGGVRHFDCASAGEVALVRSLLPEAAIHFMHPVKARSAIREAWQRQGVRDFVLDTPEELAKIGAETGAGAAEGLGLFVRLALPKGVARYDLSGKFGAEPEAAAALLRAARPRAARLGLCFHVGSQCLDPLAWRRALALAGAVIRAAGVAVDVIDVGGGFPVAYPGVTPPPLGAFFAEIEAAFEALALPGAALWAEPGRALVAGGGSVVVQVQQRRDGALYVNDGVYGMLSDAGAPGFVFPCRLIRPDGPAAAEQEDFVLFGPTCDSADRMAGPFRLPADIREGDWIEIGQLGAYGACLRTAFNGFDRARMVEVRDRPMLEATEIGLAEEALVEETLAEAA